MKTRNGFVSNSSTSSFVVRTKDDPLFLFGKEQKTYLTEKEINLLKKYGFVQSSEGGPSHIHSFPKEIDKNGVFLIYWVVCNQDEVIDFLLEHDINFIASVHYDNYFYSYQKETGRILIAENYGTQIEMYSRYRSFDDEWLKRQVKHAEEKPGIRIYTKEEFLEGEY